MMVLIEVENFSPEAQGLYFTISLFPFFACTLHFLVNVFYLVNGGQDSYHL